MKKFIYLVCFFSIAVISSCYAEITTYDDYFKSMDASNYDQLIESIHFNDNDMIYGGIKRIGELKLTNAKKDVFSWMAQSNPMANEGNQKMASQLKDIFLISVWTIGQIGDNQDAIEISKYLKDIKDKESRMVMIQALGEIRPSPVGLETLNNLSGEITDEKAANILLVAVLKHNSKSSSQYLIKMSTRNGFSSDFKKRLINAANFLLKSGK